MNTVVQLAKAGRWKEKVKYIYGQKLYDGTWFVKLDSESSEWCLLADIGLDGVGMNLRFWLCWIQVRRGAWYCGRLRVVPFQK